MDITIRLANQTDNKAIASILRDIGWFSHINDEPDSVVFERISKHLELCLVDNSHSIYVAENDEEQIVGYTSVHWIPYILLKCPEGFISELFIHPRFQGNGIGNKLLSVVKQEAMERGCSRLSLLNPRDRESYKREFYKKSGWREREKMANFIYELS